MDNSSRTSSKRVAWLKMFKHKYLAPKWVSNPPLLPPLRLSSSLPEESIVVVPPLIPNNHSFLKLWVDHLLDKIVLSHHFWLSQFRL
jgi:hypothetical protein